MKRKRSDGDQMVLLNKSIKQSWGRSHVPVWQLEWIRKCKKKQMLNLATNGKTWCLWQTCGIPADCGYGWTVHHSTAQSNTAPVTYPRSKLWPGDREKGTYLVPKMSPSCDPYSLGEHSKSLYGITLVILRPKFHSGKGAWCAEAWGVAGMNRPI